MSGALQRSIEHGNSSRSHACCVADRCRKLIWCTSMPWSPDDYRLAALERIGEALQLKRAHRHVISMYTAGLAAECMLRAYRRAEMPFDERHDLRELLKACDVDRLGEAGKARLRVPIQTIHQLWTNSLRFSHEKKARSRLRAMGLDRGYPRNADPLKNRCTELWDACSEVVTVGEQRWKKA